MSDNAPGAGTDSYLRQIAETIAADLERIDKAIFRYPRELKSAGPVRAAIALTVAELRGHADV